MWTSCCRPSAAPWSSRDPYPALRLNPAAYTSFELVPHRPRNRAFRGGGLALCNRRAIPVQQHTGCSGKPTSLFALPHGVQILAILRKKQPATTYCRPITKMVAISPQPIHGCCRRPKRRAG